MNYESLTPGVVIDGFTLVDLLHQGTTSILWQVTGHDIAFPVVMKIPRLKSGDDSSAIAGFEVEQMMLPRLAGPHVPQFVAAGNFDIFPYIVMEHIPGATLQELMTGKMSAGEAARLGARIGTAVHEIHRQHVIHLDLKPVNILFRETGEAVLVDFGHSRHDQLPDLRAGECRMPRGSGPYVAPEQLSCFRNDLRSDLFAVGVMLYQMVTGEYPYGNPSNMQRARRRLYQDPIPPSAVNPECPPWLQEVIMGCLEVDPEKRYFTAALVAFYLQNPDYVVLTARGRRLKRDSVLAVVKRWLQYIGSEYETKVSVANRLDAAPIIMVAVDLDHNAEPVNEALRNAVLRVLHAETGARLTCVYVRRVSRIGIDAAFDADGRNVGMKRLMELKLWAHPLGLPADQLSFHVLDEPDIAAGLIAYACRNHVDQIIITGRTNLNLLQRMGSVSARVVADAPCTVTVVHARQRPCL